MATKQFEKKAPKKPKIDKKTLITIAVSVVLLVAIGFGIFFTVDYILVDTPYDGVNLSKHIQVAKYMGADISKAEIDKELADSKDALIDNFTKKIPVQFGKIEKGMNVTVSITAKVDGAAVKTASYTSYEIADIGSHETTENKEFFKALEAHILEKVTKFDFDDPGYINAAPALKYKYPDDYKVTEVKGKEVLHEIYITAVTTTDAPEYNDAFFADNKDAITAFLGINKEFNSVAEFEGYMREQIELNTLWNNIVEASTVKKFPKKFKKRYEKEFDEYYNSIMEQQGLTRAQLLSQMGTDEDGYVQARTEYAEGIVKEEMVLYEIIQSEKIRVDSKEYKAAAIKLAKEGGYGDTVKDFEKSVGKDIAERTIIWEKVKEILVKNANRVD